MSDENENIIPFDAARVKIELEKLATGSARLKKAAEVNSEQAKLLAQRIAEMKRSLEEARKSKEDRETD